MVDNIFIQLSVLLGITVSIAAVMRLLRQPLMSAYIVAGIIAGPLFLNLIHGDTDTYEAFAQFGVILLLFVVGLSLNFEKIKEISRTATITGIVQVIVTGSVGFLILKTLGFATLPAIYLGVAITFSSTIIISKLLGDKRDTESTYGRNVFGLMIIQDIIAIVIMLLLTSSRNGETVAEALTIFAAKSSIILVVVYFLSRYLLPKILDHVAKSGEFLFLFTTAWCFGIASTLSWAGFSIEMGAIVAGLTLGSSPYQPQIISRIKPLRDFFIVLFFIILGSEMSLSGLNTALLPALALSIFIIIGNPIILYILYRLQKFTRRNCFLAAVTSAQVSEFGFILLFLGVQMGHLSGAELSIFTLVALTTIFLSSYIITYNEQLYRLFLPVFHLFGPDRYLKKDEAMPEYEVFVFGYHRIGWKLCEALAEKKVSYAVVDFNPEAISKLKSRGIPSYFGDAADVEFLSSLPLAKAKLVISTLPAADDQLALIHHIREQNHKTKIITNVYHNTHLDILYEAGADYVMMPHLLGGYWIASVLKDSPWTKRTFDLLRKEQKEEMKLRFTSGTSN